MPHHLAREITLQASEAVPNETGGILTGYWTADGTCVVVGVVGPGPEAIHRRTSFTPDPLYHEEEIARIYESSARMHTYLGDWHSHPSAAAYLSRRDLRTIRRISVCANARAPNALMLVIGSGRMEQWELRAWVQPPRVRGRWGSYWSRPIALQIRWY